jgi:hypothetical protein
MSEAAMALAHSETFRLFTFHEVKSGKLNSDDRDRLSEYN